MNEPEDLQHPLVHQIERVRTLARQALVSPDQLIRPELTAALFDFHALTKDAHHFEDAGETARSLATLLHHCSGRVPNEQERPQVSVLLGNLLHEISPEAKGGVTEILPPLVTPIAPSSPSVNRRIALFVDNGTVQVMLRETLSHEGFEPVGIDSLESLRTVDDTNRPVAIIADLSLCQLQPQCHEVFASLRRRFVPAPHLFCIAASDDIPARLEAVRLGATRFLPQPVDTARLVAILKGVTRQTPTQAFRVVIVEDDPFLGELYHEYMKDAGIEARVVNDPLGAPATIAEFGPDIIVSDIFMPGCNGFELLALLRQDDALADTPIVLLSSEQDATRQLEALNLGADDFLTKPVDNELLVAAIVARAKRARMLKRSRSEYRRVLQRMRDMEPYLPESFPGQRPSGVELDHYFYETINMDDYVVDEIGRDDEAGKR